MLLGKPVCAWLALPLRFSLELGIKTSTEDRGIDINSKRSHPLQATGLPGGCQAQACVRRKCMSVRCSIADVPSGRKGTRFLLGAEELIVTVSVGRALRRASRDTLPAGTGLVVGAVRVRDALHEKVVKERRIELVLKGAPLLAVLALPCDVEALALGFLVSEGLWRDREQLPGVHFDASAGQVRRTGPFDEDAAESSHRRWTFGTGCRP